MRDGALWGCQTAVDALKRNPHCAVWRRSIIRAPMKLLLVEENAAMQTTLQRSFERRGIQVVVCGDGALALNG